MPPNCPALVDPTGTSAADTRPSGAAAHLAACAGWAARAHTWCLLGRSSGPCPHHTHQHSGCTRPCCRQMTAARCCRPRAARTQPSCTARCRAASAACCSRRPSSLRRGGQGAAASTLKERCAAAAVAPAAAMQCTACVSACGMHHMAGSTHLPGSCTSPPGGCRRPQSCRWLGPPTGTTGCSAAAAWRGWAAAAGSPGTSRPAWRGSAAPIPAC